MFLRPLSLPKQGGEDKVAKARQRPKKNEPKVNVASGLEIKGPMDVVDEEDESEEDQLK